jgi:hypothetical protein
MPTSRLQIGAIAGALMASSPVSAAETTTYTYDARGRVVHAARAGSVNNGITTSYQFDKADNRVAVTTSGAAGTGGGGTGGGGTGGGGTGGGGTPPPIQPASSSAVVVPIDSYRIIALPGLNN